ncbi:MAG TPA: DinB family protein [Pirellulales bacterium]|nr:DinB family protein [Pirellulales bacterium]
MVGDRYFPSIRRLAEYEVWCNATVFRKAAALDQAELRQRFPFGFGTIHATLFHIANVLRTWSSCVGPEIVRPDPLPYDPQAPLDAIARLNDELSAAFLAAIDRSHAAGLLERDRRIEQVFHLVTHGTHHRTQVITMLRLLGKDPPLEAGDFGGWSRPSIVPK